MTASEKTADGPALPNTSITRTSCCGFSGAGKANTSDISAVGSDSARGPEKWSDMAMTFLDEPGSSCCRSRSAFDRGKSRRHHEAVALVHEIRGFVGQFQVIQPFRVCHHGGASAGTIGGVLEWPEMHDRVEIATFRVQIRKRLAEMTRLRRQPVFGVKLKLLRELSRLHAICADIDEHGASP